MKYINGTDKGKTKGSEDNTLQYQFFTTNFNCIGPKSSIGLHDKRRSCNCMNQDIRVSLLGFNGRKRIKRVGGTERFMWLRA
jgi:hypothetical protein